MTETRAGEARGEPRGYTPEELWRAARRRVRPVSAVFTAVLVAGGVVAFTVPDEYRAEAVIVLEPSRPHAELVTPATTALLEDRLRVARQQLLATDRLAAVVHAQPPFQALAQRSGDDVAIAELRKHLEIKPDGDSAILVSYRTPRRAEADRIVAAVSGGFVQANAELRIGQASRVLETLASELDEVTRALEGRETEVRRFRFAHDGELPEQVEANLREAERATHLLEGSKAWLRDVERRRDDAPAKPATPETQRLAVVEAELVRQLNHARSLFSQDHPETVRLGRELAGVQRLSHEAALRAEQAVQDRSALERAWRKARVEVKGLEQRAQQARDRAAAAARWSSELAVLERDRDLLREKYRSLLSRRVEAEVALALERRAAPLATRVVIQGGTGAVPVGPDRARLAWMAVMFAAALGGATGAFLEARDVSLRTPAEVRAHLGLPLLAVVPNLKSGR